MEIWEFQNRLNDNLKWLGGAEDQLEQISSWIDNSSENVDEAKDAFQNLKIDFAARQKEIDKTFETGNKILSNSHSSSIPTIKHWLGALNAGSWIPLQTRTILKPALTHFSRMEWE